MALDLRTTVLEAIDVAQRDLEARLMIADSCPTALTWRRWMSLLSHSGVRGNDLAVG